MEALQHFLQRDDLSVLLLSAGLALLSSFILYRLSRSNVPSSVQKVPGPPGRSWLFGDYRQYRVAPSGVFPNELHDQFGDVVRFKGFARQDYLQVTDCRALTHMLQNHPYVWQKSEPNRERLLRLTGKAVVFVNGEAHKRQRRILHPAFVAAQVNLQTPIMYECGRNLMARWNSKIAQQKEPVIFELLGEFSKAALDVVGKAAFNYEFGAIADDNNPLATAFEGSVAKAFTKQPQWVLALNELSTYVPLPLFYLQNFIPSERYQGLRRAMVQMRASSRRILQQAESTAVDAESKDTLSLLLASHRKEADKSKSLSKTEMRDEMTGIILGGHETTANSLSWTCWSLSTLPNVQEKLREECVQAFQDAGRDELTIEELEALPYLDAVIKEGLRLHPVVERLERVSTADDIVPLGKPIKNKDGQMIDHLVTKKGQRVFVPTNVLNWSKEIWGEDAMDFVPERWEKKNPASVRIPTVYAGLASFGAGARACLGFRMAVLEMKILLSLVAANFKIEPRDNKPMIVEKVSGNFMTPSIVGEESLGPRMPLKLVPVNA